MAYDAAAVYASLPEFKSEIRETTTDNDADLQRALSEASRVWDALCNVPDGFFAGEAAGAVKYLDVPTGHGGSVSIPPAMAITAVATDDDGDRTYETAWSSSTDYRLYPLDGPPYEELRVDLVNGTRSLMAGDARLKLTGTFGLSVGVPGPVQRVVRLIANRYRVRPNTPEGISSGGDQMMALAAVDPDVVAILRAGFRRPEIFA